MTRDPRLATGVLLQIDQAEVTFVHIQHPGGQAFAPFQVGREAHFCPADAGGQGQAPFLEIFQGILGRPFRRHISTASFTAARWGILSMNRI